MISNWKGLVNEVGLSKTFTFTIRTMCVAPCGAFIDPGRRFSRKEMGFSKVECGEQRPFCDTKATP